MPSHGVVATMVCIIMLLAHTKTFSGCPTKCRITPQRLLVHLSSVLYPNALNVTLLASYSFRSRTLNNNILLPQANVKQLKYIRTYSTLLLKFSFSFYFLPVAAELCCLKPHYVKIHSIFPTFNVLRLPLNYYLAERRSVGTR